KGVDILVATPGRLLDHHGQRTLDLSHVEIFVLDEADRMLDMGFIHDIKKVLAVVPAKKQSLLFSATFSDDIKALADRLLNQPALIEVARRNQTADTIAQKIHPVGREKKKELLAHLIKQGNWHQVLVFTRMKHGANRLAEQLNKDGIAAAAIHGNKSQGARTKALADFKSGDLQVLVATDIAARGIDIDQLPHVVNFELPNVPEDYVHRIGRTGRAGAQGEALSLVCLDEEGFLADIEKLIKRQLPRETIAGYEIPAGERPEPIQIGRRTLNGGNSRGGHAAGHGGRGNAAPQGRGPRPAPAPQARPAQGRGPSSHAGNSAGGHAGQPAPRSDRPAGNGRPPEARTASGRQDPRGPRPAGSGQGGQPRHGGEHRPAASADRSNGGGRDGGNRSGEARRGPALTRAPQRG
ncbi:MAG: hypothetical protein RLZZ584_4390, partial [Pseudomonadota bacterium]